MTPDEAIEINKKVKDYAYFARDAIQLGIEALERLKDLRRMKYVTDFTLLPSETEGGKE